METKVFFAKRNLVEDFPQVKEFSNNYGRKNVGKILQE